MDQENGDGMAQERCGASSGIAIASATFATSSELFSRMP